MMYDDGYASILQITSSGNSIDAIIELYPFVYQIKDNAIAFKFDNQYDGFQLQALLYSNFVALLAQPATK